MKKFLGQMKYFQLDKITMRDYFLILIGSILQATALRGFLIPAKLASGGVSGLSQIINR
jgi:uncharacterized membrane-anchored protein YitT (DUF2179 family)